MTYGEKITSDERFNRTGLDLLARMIYVEAEGESEMGKRAVACVYQISSIFTLGTDTQTSCLCITQGRTGTNFEVLLLSGAPCFYVTGFYFQICQITTTTLQGTNGYIQAAEEFYGIGPHLVIPIHGILRLTQNYHLLLLELVYTVYTSLLDAVGTYFLTEAIPQ